MTCHPARPAARIAPLPPDLASFDRVAVAFSGGKDSLACLLHLLESGVPTSRIELHHHEVDGGEDAFMDWPCTGAYCRAVAAAFGVPIYFSSRIGGFRREMDRRDAPTAPMRWEGPDGTAGLAGGRSDRLGTRGYFPQVSVDLSVRWCSPALKIDVFDAVIRAQDRFLEGRTLVVTGERAEESPGRAGYPAFAAHRTDTRDGPRRARWIDHWRPVHGWREAQVWEIIRQSGVVPHLAYQIGWGRLSCMCCIFGSPDQWATIRVVFPHRFAIIAARERASGRTIQRRACIEALADRGRPFPAALNRPDLVALAERADWRLPVLIRPDAWTYPAGAFGDAAGPT